MKTIFIPLLFALSLSLHAANQPNVLFISVDDWNDWVGAYNTHPQAKTPNLDRLAARGVAFTYAHTSAVYCAPSRTSIMTGRNPHSTGCYYDEPYFAPANHPDIKDIPIWFRDHGYYVAGGGKIYHHMPGFIDMRGWDEYFHWNDVHKKKGWHLNSWAEGAPLPAEIPSSPIAKYLLEQTLKTNPNKKVTKLNSHMEWGVLPDDDEEKMADTICANWAADFLKNRPANNTPFFLGFGLYAPHKPNFVPQKYFKMHPLKDIIKPGMHPNDLSDLPPALQKKSIHRKAHVHDPMHKLKCASKAVRGYLAALSYADAMVGRVLDALDNSPHAENTIVVLWSDNGYHLGEKGAWAKHTLWERTSNVPFIWAGPGIEKGHTVDTTVSLLDTYPTLLRLCGLPANPNNEGLSLTKVLADPSSATDRTVLQGNHHSFAAINQEWRYTRYDNGEEELYHVSEDPGEHTNLAENPEYQKTKATMGKHIPTEWARDGLRPKDPQLILRTNGDKFEWITKDKPATK